MRNKKAEMIKRTEWSITVENKRKQFCLKSNILNELKIYYWKILLAFFSTSCNYIY